VNRLLLVALFVEIGIVLVIVPWSEYWERNYFGEWLPFLQDALLNDYVRGAVSGLGVLNLLAAVAEAVSLFLARRTTDDGAAAHTRPATED
jgi:hypothetical protein